MIAGWMIYTAVVTALLALAAWAVERPLRSAGRATRGVWAVAVAAALVLSARAAAFPRVEIVVSEIGSAPAEAAALDVVRRSLDAMTSPPPLSLDLDPWALGLWAALSLGMGILVIRAKTRLGRARASWTPTTLDGRDVLLTDDTGPATLAWGRSAIVVPRWALGLPPADRELLLRHEEEHLLARDTLLLMAALGILVLMPWNPALWWMTARLGQAIEVDCDRRVLAGSTDLHRYAHLLLDIGRRGAPIHAGVLAFARPAPFLERRIRVMTDRTRPNVLRATALAGFAALLAFGACQVDRPSIVEPERAEAIQEQRPESGFAVEVRTGGSTITGSVMNSATGQPVSTAQVSIPALGVGALTNDRGRFLLLNVPDGEHELAISHEDHETWEYTVRMEPGSDAPPPPTPDESTREEIRQIRELPPAPPAPVGNAGTFTGTVVFPDGTPVQAAQISIPGLKMGALTNIEGRFIVLGLPEGTHEVEIGRFDPESRASHVLTTIQIEVTAGETTRQDRIEIARR